MTVTTSYPGVYVQEDASPVISVSTLPTAVPVFLFNNRTEFQQMTRVNSWMHYAQIVSVNLNDYADAGVRAYFNNGGGPCYACNRDSLTRDLPLYPDITLIVAVGCNIEDMVSKLCIPGGGLFALLDVPVWDEIISSATLKWFTSSPGAAAYYPWLGASWTTTRIPASAVMAGVYCASDRGQGVWKAPANITLSADLTPVDRVSDDIQGQFSTGCAINMIRTFEGRGTVVWGARTLEDSDNWRYISVRRLFDSAERDLKKAMSSMLFEPNTSSTWEKVRTAITNYMHSLWRQGALQGATEKQAYFVQIGKGTTMTDDDINQGRMIAKVGMAAVRPAEFIILQITQNMKHN
jgi:hypothetical protein